MNNRISEHLTRRISENLTPLFRFAKNAGFGLGFFVLFAVLGFIAAECVSRYILRRGTGGASEALAEATTKIINSTDSGTKIIHRPVAGCSKGWTEYPNAFQEKDGAFVPGCTRQVGPVDGHMVFDYLLPGESCRAGFLVLPPSPDGEGR